MRAPTLSLFLTTLGILTVLCPFAWAADVTVTLPAGDGFAVRDNTGSIVRLRVDEVTGNVSRNGALFVHTTGGTFVGRDAGSASIGGVRNTGFGRNALRSNTGSFYYGQYDGSYNSAFGADALYSNTTGTSNSAFGDGALRSTTSSSNSAFGAGALRADTTGSRNSAFGRDALYSTSSGQYNSAFGDSALQANAVGSRNAAFGFRALASNTGSESSAFGHDALRSNTTGVYNSAFGYRALASNTVANRNSAFGWGALRSSTGFQNTAFGAFALEDTTSGQFNTAIGEQALASNTTGFRNVALGLGAGVGQDTGSNNIYIDSNGVSGESGKIKIGRSVHTETFIEGIRGNTATGGVAVLINSSNELHTLVSSARFKRDVHDMGVTSEVLSKLRPVVFRYRAELNGDGEDVPEYGLIAEEVAEVAPELVVHDAEGQPYSVRYHVLAPMLLNEMQKQQRTIETLLARLRDLERQANEEVAATGL